MKEIALGLMQSGVGSVLIACVLGGLALLLTAMWVVRVVRLFSSSARRGSGLLRTAAMAVLMAGWTIYFVAFSVWGLDASIFSKVVRSLLSAVVMFVGSSTYQEIAGATNNALFMHCFGAVHLAAVVVTAFFVVRLFATRLFSAWKAMAWSAKAADASLNVFFGFNERTLSMVRSMQKNTGGGYNRTYRRNRPSGRGRHC